MPTLPNELIEQCVSHISPTDKATCLAASKASAACHQAATPLLYRELCTSSAVAADESDGSFVSLTNLQLLCRTLILKPAFAHFPESLSHDLRARALEASTRRRMYRESRVWNGLHLRGRLDIEVCRALKAMAESEDGGPMLEDEPWLLLIFGLCPNIRTLKLSGQPNLIQKMPLLQMLLQYESLRKRLDDAQDPHLLFVEHVTLDNSAVPDAPLTAADVATMLLLPQIRSLSLNSFTRSSQVYSVNGPLSTLESLCVERCDGRTEDLEILLPRCGNLRHLDIEYANREDMHGYSGWSSLGTILRAACRQMETLRLDSGPRWEKNMSEDVVETLRKGRGQGLAATDASARSRAGGLGDLRCMSKLHTLTVSQNALRDDLGLALLGPLVDASMPPPLAELLPPSLRRLTVVCQGDWVRGNTVVLEDPFVAGLEECVVLNSSKTHWCSKSGGEGSIVDD